MDKTKAKEILSVMSAPEERKEMTALELADFNKNLSGIMASIKENLVALGGAVKMLADHSASHKESIDSLHKSIRALRGDLGEYTKAHSESASAIKEETVKEIRGLGGALPASLAAETNKNAGPLYKTMINHLAGMQTAMSNWKYPQYSAVSVRNKNFANINPAQDTVATNVGTTTVTVASAGTPVQMSTASVPCTRVIVQCHESNTGPITVGNSNVIGALTGRKGWTIYPTNSQEFHVSDLNLLYVDAVNSGDKAHIYYETVS